MDNQERSVLSIIQDIKSGSLDPKQLDMDTRRQCVEVLMLEGYQISQIAQILGCSEKTVKRDRDVLREKNTLYPSIELAKQLIGDLVMKAEVHCNALMRLARNKEGSIGEKAQAEFLCWKIIEEKTKLLQSLGFLPLAPRQISAEIYHHDRQNDAATFGELKNELASIEGIADKEGILDEAMKEKINLLRLKIEKEEIVKDIDNLNDGKTKKEDFDEQQPK